MLKRIALALTWLALAAAPSLAASSTLSGLSAGTTITDADLFYDVQSAGSGGVKITASQLAAYMNTKGVGVVSKTTVALSSTNILNAKTTPVQLVAPQGANTAIQLVAISYAFTAVTTPYSANASAAGVNYCILSPSVTCYGVDQGDGGCPLGAASQVCPGVAEIDSIPVANAANRGLYYFNAGDAYTGGNGTMKITVIWSTFPTQ